MSANHTSAQRSGTACHAATREFRGARVFSNFVMVLFLRLANRRGSVVLRLVRLQAGSIAALRHQANDRPAVFHDRPYNL